MLGRKKGFTMLFVIIVAALLGGICAELTVTNYIKILQIRKSESLLKAKNNALLALGLALGKLQKFSGTDCVLTANSNFFANTKENKKCLTGVWKNKSPHPEFLTWLASDERSINFDFIFQDAPKNLVKIFSAGKLNDIFIPSVEIKESTKIVGRYGFWLSDESQKAKINLVDKYAHSSDFLAKKIHYSCPQRIDVSTIFGKLDGLNMAKIDFPEQLALISDTFLEKFLQNNHSITLHSYGVLSNAKSGGYKEDLTQIAQNFTPGKNIPQRLFSSQNNLPAYIPTLEFLASYINLADKNQDGEMGISATFPLFRPQMFKDYSSSFSTVFDSDLSPATEHGIYPIIAQANLNIGLAAVNGNFAITIMPQIAVWNPYNVDLKIANYSVELCVPREGMKYNPSIALFGFNPEQQSFLKLGNFSLISSISDQLSRIFRANFTSGFKAGEMKIFSLEATQELTSESFGTLISGDVFANFLYINTKQLSDKYTAAKLLCTDEDGMVNRHWNCFYWRLRDNSTGRILQEIAELDPIENLALEGEHVLSNQNQNYFSFIFRMKYGAINDAAGEQGIRWLATCSPRAPCINRASVQEYSLPFAQQNFAAGNWNFDSSASICANPLRIDNALARYLNGLSLFTTPDPKYGILNLGDLRHVSFAPFGYFSTQIFGNSRANPLIPIHKTFHENSNLADIWPSRYRCESLYDYSYLLNDSILNKYFVSTKIKGKEINSNLDFLMNKRFKLLNPARLDKIESLPEILLVDGSFNVNSQDATAWQCILSSVKNEDNRTIFPRFTPKNFHESFPGFENDKILKFAKNLAENCKEKGKLFTDIGEFANRVVSDIPENCTREGALQRAIDGSALNSDIEHTYINFNKRIPEYDNISASGLLEENLPVVVNQGDVLQQIVHFICARGDTFLLRAFGDCVDKSGRSTERAYCEAIIQRIPEYVDSDKNRASDSYDQLSELNKKLGRRYKVILFRWLSEDEI